VPPKSKRPVFLGGVTLPGNHITPKGVLSPGGGGKEPELSLSRAKRRNLERGKKGISAHPV